jgi:hypothetical protein
MSLYDLFWVSFADHGMDIQIWEIYSKPKHILFVTQEKSLTLAVQTYVEV